MKPNHPYGWLAAAPTLMVAVSYLLMFGMMMVIANAVAYVAHIQAPGILTASAEFLQPIAHDTLGWFVSDKSELPAFVLGVLLTAFSFFGLYLIKAHDFSLVMKFGFAGKNSKKTYEDMLKLVKGEDVEIGPLLG